MTNPAADFANGLRQTPEELVISALVMAPFVLAITVLVNAITWWPSVTMMVMFVALMVPAAVWNAGLRSAGSDG